MKFHKVIENPETGWSDLEWPIMTGYKMACCDCGLVHDIELYVYEITKTHKDGTFNAKHKRGKKWRVALKARRNKRSTGQLRRYLK